MRSTVPGTIFHNTATTDGSSYVLLVPYNGSVHSTCIVRTTTSCRRTVELLLTTTYYSTIIMVMQYHRGSYDYQFGTCTGTSN